MVHSFMRNVANIKNYNSFLLQDKKTIKINFIKKIKSSFIGEIEGIDSPEEAKNYTNKFIYIERYSLPKTKQNEYYYTDLVGLCVYVKAKKIGIIVNVDNHGAGDYCEVKKKTGFMLFPFIDDHIRQINLRKKIITLNEEYYKDEV